MITNIRLHYKKDFAGMRREMPRVLEKAGTDAGVNWFKNMLPQHFAENAWRRYGYKERSKSYVKRKLRVMKHNRPLEYSGAMRRALTSSGSIKATVKQIAVRMAGPRWLKGWIAMAGRTRGNGRPANYPNKERELKTILNSERKILSKVYHARVVKELKALRAERTQNL